MGQNITSRLNNLKLSYQKKGYESAKNVAGQHVTPMVLVVTDPVTIAMLQDCKTSSNCGVPIEKDWFKKKIYSRGLESPVFNSNYNTNNVFCKHNLISFEIFHTDADSNIFIWNYRLGP